jgi:hypothetical protein
LSGVYVMAWIVVATLQGQPLVQKQVRVEPRACHLPAVKAEYPLDGVWKPVTVAIRCGR